MDSKAKKTLYTVYNITVTVVLSVCTVLLIAMFIRIYNSEEKFTREAIAGGFLSLSPILFVAAVLIVAGAFIKENKKTKTEIDNEYALKAVSRKYESNSEDIKAQEKNRVILNCAFSVFCVLAFVFPFFYLIDMSNFPSAVSLVGSEVNRNILAAFIAVFIPTVIVFAVGVLKAYLFEKSFKKQRELLLRDIKNGTAKEKSNNSISSKSYVTYVRCILFTLAVVLIVIGITNGGINDVYGKAVKICTECIGLG